MTNAWYRQSGQNSCWGPLRRVRRTRSLPIIGFGELAVLVCWVVVLGVVGPVGACGVGVLGRLVAVAGFFGAASGFFGVLGGVGGPAGGGVGESEVGEAL